MITLRAFFEQARAGVLTAIRCERCGALAMPPRESCAACRAHAWAVVVLSGRGAIASFTVAPEGCMVAPEEPRGPAEPGRRAVALVALTEGSTIYGRLVDIPLEQLAVGLPVKFRPLVNDAHTAVGFGPL